MLLAGSIRWSVCLNERDLNMTWVGRDSAPFPVALYSTSSQIIPPRRLSIRCRRCSAINNIGTLQLNLTASSSASSGTIAVAEWMSP